MNTGKKRRRAIALCVLLALLAVGYPGTAFAAGQTLGSVREEENTNTTEENVQTIGPNVILQGTIGEVSDERISDGSDVFKIILPSDGVLGLQFQIAEIDGVAGEVTTGFADLVIGGVNGGYFPVILDQTTQNHSQSGFFGLRAGTYYISIGNMSNGSFAYSLALPFEAAVYSDREPDDNESQAIAIAPGGAAGGNVGFFGTGNLRDGSDFYSVTLTERGSLKVSLDAYGSEGFLLGLGMSGNGMQTRYLQNVAPGKSGSFLTDTLSAGTYWIYTGSVVQLPDGTWGSYRITTTFYPETAPQNVSAIPSASQVTIDGKAVSFQAYTIGGYNYFKLRDLAFALKDTGKAFEVAWDSSQNAIVLTTGAPYTAVGGELSTRGTSLSVTAAPTASPLLVGGLQTPCKAYLINSNNYFKLRDVAAIVDFSVTWDTDAQTIRIDTSKGYTPQ